MNINKKNKAVNLICKALATQFVLLLICGLLLKIDIVSEESLIIFFLISSGLFIYAYFPLIKACSNYIESKGYSAYFGGFGLLSFFGVFILSVIPPKDYIVNSEEQSEKNPFNYINIMEFFVFYLIVPFFIAVSLGTHDNYDNSEYTEKILENFWQTWILLIWVLLVLRDLKLANFKIHHFIPNLQLNWSFTIKIAIFFFIFSISFHGLIGYYLSLIFPNYIENLLNSNQSTNVAINLLLFLFELLFINFLIGIVFQKLLIKYRNRKAIVILSSIISLISILSYPPSFITEFLFYIIMFILFLKTANLLNCILFQICVEAFTTISSFLFYGFNSSFFSIAEYQQKHEQWLIFYLIMIIISFSLIINFIYKSFPKQNDMIPYDRNNSLN